ncbi:MAG: sulfotransferase [Gemmataceae bacterium]
MNEEVIIVSGLPRSGTSVMMQLLSAGGIAPLTDNLRVADTDNPRGYYEFERAKKIKEDAAWLPDARGKVVKMVSQLLYDLPASERYRILFMERDLDEVITSQEKMLTRLGRTAAPREQIRHSYTLHLNRLRRWLGEQPNFAVLPVRYAALVARPEEEARLVHDFLGGRLNVVAAIAAVDPSLYRNRATVKT